MTQVAVLEGADAFHERVEYLARGICEQQVLDERHLPGLFPASQGDHLPHQRSEVANVLGLQHLPGGEFGVAAAQVAHHEPAVALGSTVASRQRSYRLRDLWLVDCHRKGRKLD